MHLAYPERSFAVAQVRCLRPDVLARRSNNGVLNWAPALPASSPGATAPADAVPTAPWSGRVDALAVEGGAVRIEDASVSPPVTLAVSDATIRVGGLSTDPATPVALEASARLLGAGSVSLHGTVVAAGPAADLEMSADALDVDIRYRIADRRLLGEHRVVATDLTLGGQVEGTEAGLAVRLAIALLKDKDGRIALDVPVEGSVDSP